MFTEKQKKELLKLLDLDEKGKEFIKNKSIALLTIKGESDKLADGWNTIFNSYPKMLDAEIVVFPDPEKVYDGLIYAMDKGGESLSKMNDLIERHSKFHEDTMSYLNDQKDICDEIMLHKNIEKNIFTFKANQTMRIPELKVRVTELYNECLMIKEEMDAIEKVVASIRINPN